MPIHDQGYRRYGGDRARTGAGWIVIARAGIRTLRRKKQLLGAAAGVMVAVCRPRRARSTLRPTFPQARDLLRREAETFRQFLDQQEFFVFFVTVYVGAGLIANDRRANALQIYLSKPLTRAEYIFGKLAILMTFLLLVTWVPAMLLLMVQIAFAGNFTFLGEQRFPVSRDHRAVGRRGPARGLDDAGAVVAVEKQPLRRHPVYRGHLLLGGHLPAWSTR